MIAGLRADELAAILMETPRAEVVCDGEGWTVIGARYNPHTNTVTLEMDE